MNQQTLHSLDSFLSRKEEPNTYDKYLASNLTRLDEISNILQSYSASSQGSETFDRFKDILSIRKYMQQYRQKTNPSITKVRLEKIKQFCICVRAAGSRSTSRRKNMDQVGSDSTSSDTKASGREKNAYQNSYTKMLLYLWPLQFRRGSYVMNQEGVDLKNVFNADEDEGLKLSPDSKSMYKDVLDGFAKWFLRFMGFRGLKSLIPDDPESPKFDLNIKTAGLIRNRLFTYIHFHSQ